MRRGVVLIVMLALLAAVPADAARDLVVRDSPHGAVATCLRPAGVPGLVGMLGPLEEGTTPYDLLRVSPAGIDMAATARLGALERCPAVAADPSGHAAVAGVARSGRHSSGIRVALAEPGGGFGAPIEVARVRRDAVGVTVAVSPRGDVVVAWTLRRTRPLPRFETRTRVAAALRPAGGTFGPVQTLTPWRVAGGFPTAHVSAAMDASGAATVAWTQALRGRRGRLGGARVAVAAAPPGGRFGRGEVVTREANEVEGLALAVGPDGRALLAHDGNGAISVYERAPGASDFGPALRPRPPRGPPSWEEPVLALAPDGSAVAAWRAGEEEPPVGILAMSRRGDGAWTAPATVQRPPRSDGAWTEYGVVFIVGADSPPTDEDNDALRVALEPGGRYVLSWGEERRAAFGQMQTIALMAEGEAGGAVSGPEAAGCPCRPVEGVVPVALAGAPPLVAYTDNVTGSFGSEFEFPRRGGRLHLAAPGPADAGPDPPRLRARGPGAATLDYGDPLRGVRVHCDAACDLRAHVVGGRGRSRGVASASLPGAGAARMTIRPGLEGHLAGPSGGESRLVVRGYAPNGRRFTEVRVPLELRRRPLPPLPRLLNVRAVRRGGAVDVTWETNRPARRESFEVAGRLASAPRFPIAHETLEGRGRRRFRVRLRREAGLRELGPMHTVAVTVRRGRQPYDGRTVVVPIVG